METTRLARGVLEDPVSPRACLIIRLIIHTIRRGPSGSVQIDDPSNVSSPDPSGADQIDVEHQATGLAVGGSNPSRRAERPGHTPYRGLTVALLKPRSTIFQIPAFDQVYPRAPAKWRFVLIVRCPTSLPGATRPRWSGREPDSSDRDVRALVADRDLAGILVRQADPNRRPPRWIHPPCQRGNLHAAATI